MKVKIDRKRKLIALYHKDGKRFIWLHLETWQKLKDEVDRKIAHSHRF